MNDVSIQLFLRNILIELLASIAPDGKYLNAPVLIVYDNYNTPSKTAGIIIEEFFSNVSVTSYGAIEKGTGKYDLVVSDNRSTGLRYRKFCNEIKNAYKYGVYNIDENMSINITDIEIEDCNMSKNDDKVSSAVVITFNKFYKY